MPYGMYNTRYVYPDLLMIDPGDSHSVMHRGAAGVEKMVAIGSTLQ